LIALNTWMDESSPLVLRLDNKLITELENAGYIASESAIRARHKAQRNARNKSKAGKTKLFGSVPVPKPVAPFEKGPAPTKITKKTAKKATSKSPTKHASAAQPAIGQILLMRPRLARGTQAQIPLRILSGGFFQ